MTFTGFDYVAFALVGLLGLMGLLRGLTHEALSLAGWIGAVLVVRWFHEPATHWLSPRTGSETGGAIVAFLLLFFGTIIAARIVAGMLGAVARKSVVGPVDRLLGMGFGAAKGVLLAAALFVLLSFSTGLFDPARRAPSWLADSRTAPFLSLTAAAMVGWVQDWQGESARPALPPDHPPIPGLPPGHPLRERLPDRGGYAPADREALDRLLKEQAEAGEEVVI